MNSINFIKSEIAKTKNYLQTYECAKEKVIQAELLVEIENYNQVLNHLKALNIIKNKKVSAFHIWVFDNYQQYKEHYKFGEYHADEDMLSKNEFNFLKKHLNYENE